MMTFTHLYKNGSTPWVPGYPLMYMQALVNNFLCENSPIHFVIRANKYNPFH